jgi:hypothetical protein
MSDSREDSKKRSFLDPDDIVKLVGPVFPGSKVPAEMAIALSATGHAVGQAIVTRAREIAVTSGVGGTRALEPQTIQLAFDQLMAEGALPARPTGASAQASTTAALFR